MNDTWTVECVMKVIRHRSDSELRAMALVIGVELRRRQSEREPTSEIPMEKWWKEGGLIWEDE